MKILLYMNKEYIFPTDYGLYMENFSKMSGNVGNKAFYTAMYNYLNTDYNELFFCELDDDLNVINYTKEEINDFFDAIVIVGFLINFDQRMGGLGYYIDALEGIKIPIHIFSASVNLSSPDQLDAFCKYTADQFEKMKKLVLEHNGSVETRGEFTQQYFERMGMKEAVMLGCPSMFQNGREFQIFKKSVDRADFKFVVCGCRELLREHRNIFRDYPNCVYMDQNQYASVLYDKKWGMESAKKYVEFLNYLKCCTAEGFSLLTENRLFLIADYYEWRKFLEDGEFSFSLGERIHGNIVAMLSGVPGFVLWHDTRTKEMADFFSIPATHYRARKRIDPYKLFCEADYSKFNKAYPALYDSFEEYLINLGLLKSKIKMSDDEELKKNQNFREHINTDNIDSIKDCKFLNSRRYCLMNAFVESCWQIYEETAGTISHLKQKLGG